MQTIAAYLLLAQSELLRSYEEGLPGLQSNSIEALARAIAASPDWPGGHGAVLVVRPFPVPALAVLGQFDAVGQSWLCGQIQSLHKACGTLRYVHPAQAEARCRNLADNLRSILGEQALAGAGFIAIPQGGLVVLDLLADLLGLAEDRLVPPFPPDLPLVIVDDCALSGARFFQFLRQTEHPSVIFATLYSHPELRAGITQREPRVAACVSAQDLEGVRLADTGASDTYYWSGRMEAICFPWNEPDRTFWNPATGRWELAWRIVPPELCSKSRPAPGTAPIPIQIQPEGKGPLRPSERTLFAEIDGQIVLFDLESGQGFGLGAVGSDLWRAILRLGDLEAVVAELGREYDADSETLRADAGRFVDDLLQRGLLEVCEAAVPALVS